MAYQRNHKPPSGQPPTQRSSQFAPRPFAAPRQAPAFAKAPSVQGELEASQQGGNLDTDLNEEELLQRKFDAGAGEPTEQPVVSLAGGGRAREGVALQHRLGSGVSVGSLGVQSPRARVVQRIVINMDPGDKTIESSAKIHKARADDLGKQLDTMRNTKSPETRLITGVLDPDAKEPPLKNLDPDEEITILAHGTPAAGGDVPRVAGLSAEEMYAHLVKMGLTLQHTGIINFSNCTSAWDRKGSGSFIDRFVGILKKDGFKNFVTGYESFTESVSVDRELEVPQDKREMFLAHKTTERYMMRLMNLRPEDAKDNNGERLKKIHAELKAGARQALSEAHDFLARKGNQTAQMLGSYYQSLGELIWQYIAEAEDVYSDDFIMKFQMAAKDLLKKYEFDNLGHRLGKEKVDAIPVVIGGE